MSLFTMLSFLFFTVPTSAEIYTLSLHDALPISARRGAGFFGHHLDGGEPRFVPGVTFGKIGHRHFHRSEEHTSELQSHSDLVCRLLLEKKKSRGPHETEAVPGRHKPRDNLVAKR